MAETPGSPLGLYVALQSTGLVEISFDPGKTVQDSMSVVSVNTDAGYMPNWVTSHGDKVYSISRSNYAGSKSSSGGVHAFQQGQGGTGLKSIGQASSNGKGGCHLEVSPDGKALAAANITGSTISIYPLSSDGVIGEPTYIFDYNKSDPESPEAHPHQSSFDPSGRFLIVPLRTMDRLDIYSYRGPEEVTKVQRITLPEAAGPRHFAINSVSDVKAYLYLLSEKDNSLRVYSLNYQGADSSEITIELLQTLSTLGKDHPLTPEDHKDLAAEVAVTSDGKFVYASNRGLQNQANDTITVYSIDQDPAHDKSHLTHVDTQRTHGKHPRDFALSPDKDNKWVAVSNQFSQDIVIFERNPTTGRLGNVRGKLNVKVARPHQPHQPKPEIVQFTKEVDLEGNVSLYDVLRGRAEGPMCVLWK